MNFMKHRYWRAKPLVERPKPAAKDPTRPMPADLAWYVLTAMFNREYLVADWLETTFGHFTLIPLETRYRVKDPRRGGFRETRIPYQVALFPRLVLIGFASQPNWLEVMDNYHVQGVLGWNGTPARMRDGEAERLRTASEALRKAKQDEVTKPLASGEKARIVAPGLFVNHVVDIVSIQGKRARTIQNWFGQLREVEIPLTDLERAA